MKNDTHVVTISDFNFQSALDSIWVHIGELDAFIQREEPFKKIKIDEDAAKSDVVYLLLELEKIATELAPFIPSTSATILQALKENKKPENLFARLP